VNFGFLQITVVLTLGLSDYETCILIGDYQSSIFSIEDYFISLYTRSLFAFSPPWNFNILYIFLHCCHTYRNSHWI